MDTKLPKVELDDLALDQATTIVIDVNDPDQLLFSEKHNSDDTTPIYIDIFESDDTNLKVPTSTISETKSDSTFFADYEKFSKCNNTLVILEEVESKKDQIETIQTCSLCTEKFSSAASFIQHIKLCHLVIDTNGTYKCPLCIYSSKLKCSVEQHLQIHTLEKPFKCKLCGKAFNQNAGLQQHAKTHSNKKPFACHLCNGTYKAASTLASHIQMTHQQLRPFQCRDCGVCFGHSSNLRIHMRTHTGERPYKCEECGRLFVQQGHLTAHMRLHTGERPFKCQYCESSFTHIGNLRQHEITQHTKNYKHRCHDCNKGFIGPSELKRHMTTTHNDSDTFGAPTCKVAKLSVT